MLQKIKGLYKKDIVKVFSLNALSTLIKMLTGFVAVKVVAVLIGPGGMALLGQLTNFSTIFLTLSTAGITTGVTKYVAEYSGSENKIKSILQTSVYITVLSSLACALLLVAGAAFFSEIILKSEQFTSIFIIFGCTITLYALNTLLLSILNGLGEFKKYALVNTAGSLIGLLFSVVLASSFGTYGALLSVVTFQSVVFIVGLFITSRSSWFRWDFFFGKFTKSEAVKLGHFSLMALASAATAPTSQLILRSYLTEKTSLTEAGLWEAMNRMSGMYLMVIETSLSVYYLPKLARIGNEIELRNEIINVYKFIVPPLLILILLIFFSKNFIIQILFDDTFQGMENLFAFQLTGDFFKICSWLLAYQMIAKSMTKMFITTEILFSLTFVVLGVIFIPMYGNVGATIGYAVNYLLYFVAMLLIFRKILLK